MSSIVLPSRGQCIHITDGIQHCQCLWFFPPESSPLDQNICGHCGHGIHAHADYISAVVNHYPVNQCAAYAQTTHLMQFCTCGAQFYEHVATYNSYCIPEPWTVFRYFNSDGNVPSTSTTTSSYSNAANSPFSQNTMPSSSHSTTMFSGDATDISFTPAYMPASSPNISPSYLYGDTVIFTPTPQPVVRCAVPQMEVHSHSEVENSRDFTSYPYSAAHGPEAWAGQLD